jgi:excisionase family DNA binding protein
VSTASTASEHADKYALSATEAAEALGVCRATIYNLLERGVLTRYKVGRATRLNAAEVRALVGGGPDDDRAA